MGRIVLSTNATLDGVGQDPTGEEGSPSGGWFNDLDDDREAWAAMYYAEALETEAVLLGGRSYEWFAGRWVGREGPWAERLASLPKYVVRSTAGRSDWGPTKVLTGDVVTAVSELRQGIDGRIAVYASHTLVRTLVEHDLLDEARLTLFPHVAGSGGRVFDLAVGRPARLAGVERIGSGLVQLRYAFGSGA
jgi:dihydrofolate reductase